MDDPQELGWQEECPKWRKYAQVKVDVDVDVKVQVEMHVQKQVEVDVEVDKECSSPAARA